MISVYNAVGCFGRNPANFQHILVLYESRTRVGVEAGLILLSASHSIPGLMAFRE